MATPVAATSDQHPRPFCSFCKLMTSRRSHIESEIITARDCLILSPVPNTNYTLLLSSPNMPFTPEPPMHVENQPFTYHSDDMLGPFEHTKWPQAYFDREPHNIAAPMDPDLLNFNISDERGPGPTFPLGPSHSITKFDDVDIPWVMFSPAQFVVSQDLPGAQVGTLCDELLRRMCTSMMKVKQMSELIGCKQMTSNTSLDRHALASRVANYKYQAYRSACLYRAYTQLTQVLMSTFDTLLWFRESQQILLDIRSWIIYMEVVKLRWDNPFFRVERPEDILPVRGIITSNITLAEHMLCIRIPV
ncbi:hypothetical protein EW146_g7153 [Bondarzewia mesenterica]|uniref:Uncharacterized protein n=1 Tax=Bondarzewia mesenterica TaxID=1095465 RepID=A0A4S4LLM2_9AGAM|nr:hypothetical protein EW146_g7153 [Bondarzewia mesenterica]